jgi:hypothetical protein
MRKWFVLGLLLILLVGCEDVWSNKLPYAGPVEKDIDKGQFLPGTEIQYLGKTEKGAQVSIDGKETKKKVGEPLEWKEELVHNVTVDQTYQITAITEDTLYTEGTVRIIVSNANPLPEPLNTDAPVHFQLPAGYHVEKGTTIPGTDITYLGQIDEGAHLNNIEDAPYPQVGDSISWTGTLREGVWLQLDLQIEALTDSQLDVLGTATLWIAP